MKNTRRSYRLAAAILTFAILSTGCANQGAAPSATLSYSPPLLPIEITYDLTTGQIRVSVSGRIQTPLGTFKVSFGAKSIEKRYNGVRTLTIITGTKKYVYQLENGRPYSIKLPSDENGQTEVRYSGADENLEIEIPNPTNETIAELKQRLKEEQEAREHAEGAPSPAPEPEGQAGQAETFVVIPVPQAPTPTPRQVRTSQECQELIAQYTPGKFLYVPPECEDMFRAYQSYLQQQEYEAKRKQEREEYEARRRQQREDYERDRREEAARRREEETARRRQRQIEQWTNIIDGIVRRRRW